MGDKNETQERIYDAITSLWGSRIIGAVFVVILLVAVFGDIIPFGDS